MQFNTIVTHNTESIAIIASKFNTIVIHNTETCI